MTVVGVLGGLATGAAMGALVVELVALTAKATSPEPSLLLSVGRGLLSAVLAGYPALAGTLVWLATARLELGQARPVAEVGA